MEDLLFLVGRIVLGGFFAFNAFNHLSQTKMMAGYAASKGVPLPGLSVIVTGLILLLGAASLITGLYPYVGVALLVGFLIPTAVIMHNFWTVDDPQAKMMEMTQFMKDTALAGAALTLLAVQTPWALSLA